MTCLSSDVNAKAIVNCKVFNVSIKNVLNFCCMKAYYLGTCVVKC